MTYEEILKRMKELKVEVYGTKNEIKELPNIMYQGETLEYVTSGTLNGNTWLISCTNKRVLFLDKGVFFGCKQLETPLEKINSVETSKGLIFGTIKIWDGAGAMKIETVPKTALQPFAEAINSAREALRDRTPEVKVVQHEEKNNNSLDDLERLAKLKEQGILTEEEFVAKKKQILGL